MGLSGKVQGLLLAFSIAACPKVLSAESDEQLIQETYRAWVEITNEKDIEKWSAFLAKKPYFHPADSPPLVGADEVIRYYEQSFADPRFSLDCKQERIDVSASGDMAWSSGRCKATFTGPDGNEASGSNAAPLIAYYEKAGLIRPIAGSGSIDDIFGRVVSVLGE